MIDFEIDPQTQKRIELFHTVAEQMMRPISREYDEHEHDKPWDFLNAMWAASTAPGGDPMGGGDASGQGAAKMRNVYTVATTEELCWGDAGLFLSIPNAGLGGAAVMAAGTPEQKERFLAPLSRRQAEVGRDGDHRARMRLRFGRGHHHRDPRRRSLGAQRHQDLLHRRAGWRWRNPRASSWSGPPSTRAPGGPGSSRSSSSMARPG